MLGAQIDHLTHSTYTAYFLYEEEMPVRLYERFFQELRPQIKLPLAAGGTLCIWFLILHARKQSLKELRVVAMESFSIEFQDTIAHKSSKKGVFEILKETMLCLISVRAWVENLHIKKLH